MRNGEIELHYQPQVRGDGAVTGVEALARWRHPSGTLLSPDVFIPVAEESTLISDIGLEVLRQACDKLKACPKGRTLGISALQSTSARSS